MRASRLALILLLPSFFLLGILVIYPLCYCIWLSLNTKHTLSPVMDFVGVSNYLYLANSPAFWRALVNGIIYSVSTITIQLLIGIVFALLLNESFKGRSIVEGIVLFPYLLPSIIAVITFKWLLNELYGLVNYVPVFLGITPTPTTWLSLGLTSTAMPAVILIGVWKFFPFAVVCILARLKTVPQEYYDAAAVDGANVWQRFRYVTLPQLKSVLFIVLLLRTIWMFNDFDTIFLATGGGPIDVTTTLPILTYLEIFRYFRMGMGASVAVTIFLILIIVHIIYSKAFGE